MPSAFSLGKEIEKTANELAETFGEPLPRFPRSDELR
jgi:hypothetical protein